MTELVETPEQIDARLAAAPTLLEVRGLNVRYLTETGEVPACVDVDLTLRRGEILGVAGESASGKTTLLTAISRLQRPPAVTASGEIWFHPREGAPVDLATLREDQLRPYRWRDIAIVMQSAMACLNPVHRLEAQFVDAIEEHEPDVDAKARAAELLGLVGIPADRLQSFPHELSGGMQQRALIALALACNPDLVVMDEPTTAVDVVMQRVIIDQLLRAQEKLGFAIIFVTHDLSLLLEISDRIAIMYAGRVVEVSSAEALYHRAHHPYSRGLRQAFPPLSDPVRRLTGIKGAPPDLQDLPTGCAFHPRCPDRIEVCSAERPELLAIGDSSIAACHVAQMQGPPTRRKELS